MYLYTYSAFRIHVRFHVLFYSNLSFVLHYFSIFFKESNWENLGSKLGKKILFCIGNEAEYFPQIRQIESPAICPDLLVSSSIWDCWYSQDLYRSSYDRFQLMFLSGSPGWGSSPMADLDLLALPPFPSTATIAPEGGPAEAPPPLSGATFAMLFPCCDFDRFPCPVVAWISSAVSGICGDGSVS